MFNLYGTYPYFEEVNDGILRCFAPRQSQKETHPCVLDVGCGQGQLGAEIRKRGYNVWGIESAPLAVEKAKSRLTRVINGDLTEVTQIAAALGDQKFDAIIFSDVLEHVVDPLLILTQYKSFLTTRGQVFISLPNVANWENRLRLLFGNFDYKDTGVMDRTHLRFFTFKTAGLLVHEAGFHVFHVGFTPHIVRVALPFIKILMADSRSDFTLDPSAITNSSAFHLYHEYLYPVERVIAGLWKSLFAFRIILGAQISPVTSKATL